MISGQIIVVVFLQCEERQTRTTGLDATYSVKQLVHGTKEPSCLYQRILHEAQYILIAI